MAHIRTVGPDEATGPLRAQYDAAVRRAGRVYQILRIMSLNPDVLDASMKLYLQVMKGPSGLSRALREMVAVVVSKANGCHY
jgi:alkylhydroperoxidase family enzyme